MDGIPITFDYRGKTYKGKFTVVAGAGKEAGSHYSLSINGFWRGDLFQIEDIEFGPRATRDPNNVQYKWVFRSWDRMFEEQEMVDYFVDVITAWYQ